MDIQERILNSMTRQEIEYWNDYQDHHSEEYCWCGKAYGANQPNHHQDWHHETGDVC